MNLIEEKLSTPNEHGVYVDNLERTQKRGRSWEAEIMLALDASDRKWRSTFAYDIYGHSVGCGGLRGLPSVRFPCYQTRKEAFQEAFIDFLEWVKRYRQGHNSTRAEQALDEMLDWLKEIDPRGPRQLSLLEVE